MSSRIHADIEALKGLHDALGRFRLAMREVTDRGDDRIEATRAALEAKAMLCQSQLDRSRAELDACRSADLDCSVHAEAVAREEERLERIRRWQERIYQEASGFGGTASRFRELLETDLPRTEEQLRGAIASLQAARRSLAMRPDQDGDQQFRLLQAAWDQASQHWHDDLARHFDARHWASLTQESHSYLEALGNLLDVLEAAERDTEP